MGDDYGLNFVERPEIHSSFIFSCLTSYLRTTNVLFAMSSLEIICAYPSNTAISRSCQHRPQPTLSRLSRFSHVVYFLFMNNFLKLMEKSTQHTLHRQIAIKSVGTDKGNKQLMICSSQAVGSVFSPKEGRGEIKKKTHLNHY